MPTFRRRGTDNPFREMRSPVVRGNAVVQEAYSMESARRIAGGDRIGRNMRLVRSPQNPLNIAVASENLRRSSRRFTRGTMPTSLRREVAGQISMFDRQPLGGSSSNST